MYAFGLTNTDQTPDQIAGDFMTLPDVDLIAILDGGGSAQMMRYNMKENRVEYVRDTGRKTSGCLAMIGAPVTIPAEPVQQELVPADSSETEKDEETPMEEVKPQEQSELTPANEWKDPDQITYTPIKARISALMAVKSLITLGMVFGYIYMVIVGIAVPRFYETIMTTLIAYYFGTQHEKQKQNR